MKQIKRSFIILFLATIAIFIKAIQNKNTIMMLVGLLLVLLLLFRMLLFKKMVNIDSIELEVENNDFIHKYLQNPKYKELYEIYKQGNCDVLYEENDGLLLYDHTSKSYLASAKTLEGARDIVRLLPQDYGKFVVFEDVFEQIEEKEFPMVKKEKEDNIHYYSK